VGQLIPNEPLIYERANGVVFARYQNKPEIPRWIIGGDPEEVSKAQGNLFSYSEWSEMMELAETYPTIKKQLQSLLTTYYTIKEHK
jgi:coenzyme F420-reducing hydrogenase beta subunit